jgi:sulfoxide reductase catalytic subunit YedY
MLIRVRKAHTVTENDVTDERLYQQRRRFLKQGVYAGASLSLSAYFPTLAWASVQQLAERIGAAKTTIKADEPLNKWEEITGYNNYYELGTDKSDPAARAEALATDPWSIRVAGHCNKPGTYPLEDLLKPVDFEERIYRLRCVEAWSMVIPWTGFPLAKLLARFEPNGNAKYVAFETIYDKRNPLPGQRWDVLDWPYREGLRMDEAMHPLAFIAVGLYGKPLPNQNGAPIRLVVPWKYGFKSIKSIAAIRFTDKEPPTSWNMAAPHEYGFYSNVNPNVDHPRWSQKKERRIGEFLKRETLMFNGYAEDIAHLYAGMDLKKNY